MCCQVFIIVKNKLYQLRQTIDDLVEIGPDYAYFMNAQIAHKNLKKIKNLLEYIGWKDIYKIGKSEVDLIWINGD